MVQFTYICYIINSHRLKNMEREPIKIELREDKILEILLHAATREDLAKIDAKIDAKSDRLDSRIDRVESRLDRLDAKIDRVTWIVIVSVLVPILLHFIK